VESLGHQGSLASAEFIGVSVVAVSVAATPFCSSVATGLTGNLGSGRAHFIRHVGASADLGAIRGKARLSDLAGVLSYLPRKCSYKLILVVSSTF
jgi:hypothetical protein